MKSQEKAETQFVSKRSGASTALLVLLAMLLGNALAGFAGAESDTKGPTLCVMTFNLRYASSTPPNAWPQRRPVMRQCIERVAPDILGTQEGLYGQLKDLAADLPQYAWIGLGRDGGSRGEFMAIFYRTNRLEPLEFDHFWLSDTPEVIASTSWGNRNRRMVTWVKFRDMPTRHEVYYFNTHLDHQVQTAREKSAQLIRQRVEALATTLPVLLGGDFNADAGTNKVYDLLVDDKGFKDTWSMAAERRGDVVGTFNNFGKPQKNGARIDWILARGPVEVDAAEIVTFQQNGQYPSDHFPVAVWLRLPQKLPAAAGP
jgi:endonuclease/exonuclease/phosphatase family metal-dependent hydrolase